MGVIMDPRDRKSLREGESSNSSHETENKKACTGCKTTKTPLWRGGPAGPKSLCNACGIRFRKKRRIERGMEKGPEKKKRKTQITSDNTNTTASTTISTITSSTAAAKSPAKVATDNGLISENLRMSLMVLGKEMMLQRSFLVKKQRCQRKRKLGEEEQAAFSLMALSCGSVFA